MRSSPDTGASTAASLQDGQVDRTGKGCQAVVQRIEISAVVVRERQQRSKRLMQRLAAVQRPPVEIDLHHDSSS